MNSNSTTLPPIAQSDLIQATEQAFTQAGQGTLTVVDLFNAAKCLTDVGQVSIAADLYRLWLSHTNSPVAYAAQFNLGVQLSTLNDLSGAETAYRAAITQQPTFIEAHLNLAGLLEQTSRQNESLPLWRSVLTIVNLDSPRDRIFYLQALNNLSRVLEASGELVEAESILTRSLQTDPTQQEIMRRWSDLRQKLCLWPVYDTSTGIPLADMLIGTSRVASLSASSEPSEHLAKAQKYSEEKILRNVRSLAPKLSYDHARLRIGYLAVDFNNLPELIPATEIFHLHDRSKFEVFAFAGSAKDRSEPNCEWEHYLCIDSLNDEDAARLIRSHEIDILVDLQGLDSSARHDILSYRPAPIQLVIPGFPGPSGHPEIDYVVSDSFVLPPTLEPFFTEKPLRLEGSILGHHNRAPSKSTLTRSECGLPKDAFVFCSFSDSSKLNPELFDCWMRILDRVPKSILWLASSNATACENLLKETERRGVSRSLLYFTKHSTPDDFASLYHLADLFLDTFPFNVGIIASNAIYNGLPILTCSGTTFASRITGSILTAAGLSDWITYTIEDYKAKALALAQNGTKTSSLMPHLPQRPPQSRIFDASSYVRNLESGYFNIINALPPRPPKARPEDLNYIIPPRPTERRYVIAAPPFQHNSAGVRILYELQQWLVRAGLDAIVCTWFPGYPVDQFADDIVIYPEVAPGNLLKAKRVVRYILNVPGQLGHGEKTYDKNEVVVAYIKDLTQYADGMILQVPSIEPFFHADNCVKTCDAVYVGKGTDLGIHPPGCIAITKGFPASRRAVAELLRSAKTLYTYDHFSMIGREAELCGCDVKLIEPDGSMVDYPRRHFPSLDEFKLQLHEFIEMTKLL